MKKLLKFFDKLEDSSRAWLSRRSILYAFVGGAGVVIFWRGVWHGMDSLMIFLSKKSIPAYPWWDGPLSILIGALLLLSTGLMVSTFIGNEVIISGLKREKKVTEKTEIEVQEEAEEVRGIKKEIEEISADLAEIKEKV